MSDQGNSTGLPLRRERRDAAQPFKLAAEHVYLTAAAGAFAAFVVMILVDHFAQVWVARGLYSMLAAWFVVACCGLIVRLEAARNRRLTCAEMAQLRKALTDALERAYEIGYVDGHRGDVVRLNPLDPETQGALDRINGRLGHRRDKR